MTNFNKNKTVKKTLPILIILFLVLISPQENVIGQYSFQPSQLEGLDQIPGLEITEEQEKNLERLLEMPTGKMNDDIWFEILIQISCLASINEKVDETTMAELVKPYGVTGEEWTAYHWQTTIEKPDAFFEKFEEMSEEEFEELKKNNCKLERGSLGKELPEEIGPPTGMTDEIWLEITARIKCIDRIALIFTKDEIEQIFKPFGVTPAEYQAYTQALLKRMEEVLEKSDDQWTEEDRILAGLNEKLKQRIEELKKKNCVLEDGTHISEEYNAPVPEPEGWDKIKCKLFFCHNCWKVTEDSSFWTKYRCKNLCKGCPAPPPPPPPVEDCLGFCSKENCPVYADKIAGVCIPQKKCRRCGPFKIFKCCEEVPSVCCLTRPPEVCQGSCGLKSCPAGTVSAGEKNCPSGKEKYRCYIFFKCYREVPGVCCVSPDEINSNN
jgi:hypothetical protein